MTQLKVFSLWFWIWPWYLHNLIFFCIYQNAVGKDFPVDLASVCNCFYVDMFSDYLLPAPLQYSLRIFSQQNLPNWSNRPSQCCIGCSHPRRLFWWMLENEDPFWDDRGPAARLSPRNKLKIFFSRPFLHCNFCRDRKWRYFFCEGLGRIFR